LDSTLRNYIGGEWLAVGNADYLDLTNPATGESLGRVPLSTRSEVDAAVDAAKTAFPAWRRVPPVQRARYLFRFKALLDEHFDEIARLVTDENGKTLDEARGSLRRGVENVEHACGIPALMMGKSLEDVASGIDCEFFRQPMGVFAAITPFNFPAMVPLWFYPYAVGTGNTFVLKPSEQVPRSQTRIFELAHEAGFPPGVLNLVHGGKDAVNAILEHPDIVGVSFVGSSPVARHVYTTAAKHGKRVQALGGAKNHIVVMPDADMDRAIDVVSESIFGCAGQRCLAGSIIVGTGRAYEPVREKLLAAAKSIRVGYGLDEGVKMGPVISQRHREKVQSYIDAGVSEGATMVLDGRATRVEQYPKGAFVGPTIFEDVIPT
jgi:malonate-semialdehyde dehydrogenase (acetylating) / methylmalonate-semialdehyde dehydrogenase